MSKQMYDHVLNILKGDHMYAVDKSVRVHADCTAFSAGMVGSLDATTGEAKVGLAVNAMPVFLYWNSGDFDVMTDPDAGSVEGSFLGAGTGNDTVERFEADGVTSRGEFAVDQRAMIRTLPAVGAFELATTEFEQGVDYTVNMPLTSAVPGVAAVPGSVIGSGTLVAGTHYVDTICGIVSEPCDTTAATPTHSPIFTTTPYKVTSLRFWPVFIPALSQATILAINP